MMRAHFVSDDTDFSVQGFQKKKKFSENKGLKISI